MKIRKSKMKKFVLETIDFTSIFKGCRIHIPFFLLCIESINHQKGVLLRDTCDYPTISNAHFTMVSEPKLSDDMKGRIFDLP